MFPNDTTASISPHPILHKLLEAATVTAAPAQPSIRAICWVLHNKRHVLHEADKSNSEIKLKPLQIEGYLSASSTTDERVERAGSALSSPESLNNSEETLGPDRLVPEWRKPKLLRTKRIERRLTGDLSDYRALLVQKCSRSRMKLRHRKSFGEEALEEAAFHGNELSQIRESMSHHSNPVSFEPVGYRRCRSAVTIDDVESSHSPEALGKHRKHSLSSVSFVNVAGELWPESITSLLTGGQGLIDRYLLFGYLEFLLCNERRSDEDLIENSTSPKSIFYGLGGLPMPSSHCRVEVAKPRVSGLSIWSSGISIPRPDKQWGWVESFSLFLSRGEDAFFTCDKSNSFLGVADGVGEWGDLGCNPRQFAEELMEGARAEAQRLQNGFSGDSRSFDTTSRASLRARQVLGAGFKSARSFGSSTSIVAGLDPEGTTLGVANIGDSSCLVLRRESKRHKHFVAFRRTKEQQHFFNCPYQLSRIPRKEDIPNLEAQGLHNLVRIVSNLCSRMEGDTPEMADLYDIRVQEGDIIIVASDGLFDNLFDQEIGSLVSLALSPYEAAILQSALCIDDFSAHPNAVVAPILHSTYGLATSPQNIAKAVAEAAFYRSLDPRAKTPFGRQSRKAGRYFAGGKIDDITAVVGWVV